MNEHLLLYYDILGFKKLLQATGVERIHQTIDSAIDEAAQVLELKPGWFNILCYSDTVLVWSRADGRDHRQHMLLWALGCTAFLNLMAQAIPIRAGVAYGRFAPPPNVTCLAQLTPEPALQEAHEYAEGHMSRAGLMGIVVAPSVSQLWTDAQLTTLVANGTISKRAESGEFYLNPFVALTPRFTEWVSQEGRHGDSDPRRNRCYAQALGALGFLLKTQQGLRRDSSTDPRVLAKYENTLAFVCGCLGKSLFAEACGRVSAQTNDARYDAPSRRRA